MTLRLKSTVGVVVAAILLSGALDRLSPALAAPPAADRPAIPARHRTIEGTERLRCVATRDIAPWVAARRETSEEAYIATMRSVFAGA